MVLSLIGVAVGFFAFVMSTVEDILVDLKIKWTAELMAEYSMILAILFMLAFVAITTLGATCLTIYYGPAATGSGVAELIAYVNGVNY